MSTAPEANEVSQTLKQLVALSQDVLNCDEDQLDKVNQLMAQREALIKRLQHLDGKLPPASAGQLRPVWDRLMQLDSQIEHRFGQWHANLARELRQFHTSRQALSGYTFPAVDSSMGVENQG